MPFGDFFERASFLADMGLDHAHLLRTSGFIASLVLVYLVAQTVYRLWFHPLAKLPGPIKYSISYAFFLYDNNYRGEFFRKAAKLQQKYGPMVRVGPNHVLLDGEIAWPQVYGRRKADGAEYEVLPSADGFGGRDIASSPRDVHHRQRKQLNYGFSDAALAQQEPVIKGYLDMLLDRLRTLANKGEEIEIVKWMNAFTFDVIGDLTFSESFNSLKNNTLHPWVGIIPESVRLRNCRRFYQHFPLLRMILSCFSDEFGTKDHPVRRHAMDMAHARMQLGEEGPAGRNDFVTYMLRKTRSGEPGMAAEEILTTSPVIILGGSETTSSVLSALWFYLIKYPRAYKRLTDEIRGSFRHEDEINFRESARLEYLMATINEMLRFYPPGAEMTARVSPGAFVEGVYLPPGTVVSTYQWATYRDPRHFVDPDSFIPERWLPASHPFYDERFKYDNRDLFKPFSVGPRDCIGKFLAVNELRLVISRILYTFDYELVEGQDDWHAKQRVYITWIKGPLKLLLKEREVVA